MEWGAKKKLCVTGQNKNSRADVDDEGVLMEKDRAWGRSTDETP